MKKFITTIPLRPIGPGHLIPRIYESYDDDRLVYDKETVFPVFYLLNRYVEKGETVQLIAIKHKYQVTYDNYEAFTNELNEFEKNKECSIDVVEVEVEYGEDTDKHLDEFCKIIEYIDDGDRVYACLTYGPKPTPIIQMMALNYAYRAKKNCSIGAFIYGGLDFESPNKDARIYDITALFYMDEIITRIGDLNVSDPLKLIKNVVKEGSKDE